MNFLFVDRILNVNPGGETVGLKYVTDHDTFLHCGSDNKFTLFPSIIGEALGQLCSWNVLKTSDFKFRPVGGVIQEIQMFAQAYVGDTIFLESHIETLDTDNHLVTFSGRASVEGKTILTVKNSLAPLLPLHEFNNPEKVRADFANLHCHPREDQHPLKIDSHLRENNTYQFVYQKLSTVGQELIAQKKISLSAPYFADHFPNKPVFPLSLLIEYNLLLATSFIKEHTAVFPDDKNLQIVAVRKVKIGNFVFPGDTVISKVTIKEHHTDRYIVSFHNEVNNKKVCVAEAELGLR